MHEVRERRPYRDVPPVVSSGVDSIRQQDYVDAFVRVKPHGGTREPGVTEAGRTEELAGRGIAFGAFGVPNRAPWCG